MTARLLLGRGLVVIALSGAVLAAPACGVVIQDSTTPVTEAPKNVEGDDLSSPIAAAPTRNPDGKKKRPTPTNPVTGRPLIIPTTTALGPNNGGPAPSLDRTSDVQSSANDSGELAGKGRSPGSGGNGGTTPTFESPQVTSPPITVPLFPTSTSTTTEYKPRLPSEFTRAPEFCEAGANFYRTGDQLFREGATLEAGTFIVRVNQWLFFWDRALKYTPPELSTEVMPIKEVRFTYATQLSSVKTYQQFTALTTQVFYARPDMVAALDTIQQWCDLKVYPRRDPPA